jgi:hypothetical protein
VQAPERREVYRAQRKKYTTSDKSLTGLFCRERDWSTD